MPSCICLTNIIHILQQVRAKYASIRTSINASPATTAAVENHLTQVVISLLKLSFISLISFIHTLKHTHAHIHTDRVDRFKTLNRLNLFNLLSTSSICGYASAKCTTPQCPGPTRALARRANRIISVHNAFSSKELKSNDLQYSIIIIFFMAWHWLMSFQLISHSIRWNRQFQFDSI